MYEENGNVINIKAARLSADPRIVGLFTKDKRLIEKVIYCVFYPKKELHVYRESSEEKGEYSCEIYDFEDVVPKFREKLGEKFVREDGVESLEQNQLIKKFFIAGIKLFSYENITEEDRKIIEEIFISAKRKVDERIKG